MAENVKWTLSAYKDFQNRIAFLARDSVDYATSFYEAVMDKANTLGEYPYRGRVVPEFGDPEKRELSVHQYRLVYRIIEGQVVITAIIHGTNK